jgi:hypothetical protein
MGRGVPILRCIAQEYGLRGLGHGRGIVSVNLADPLDTVLTSFLIVLVCAIRTRERDLQRNA